MDANLTPALEDYLEAILQLSEETGKAKISEIARRLNIAKPSANQAINNLRREGLVSQERYGPVYLTEKGRRKAEEVWRRHRIISRFLHEVLQVSAPVAENDACLIEHVISPETVARIADWLGEKPGSDLSPAAVTLDSLQPGQKARIVKLQGKSTPVKRRILEMGLVPGVELLVERVAPLGNPMEVQIQDYHISLRREEAAFVLVNIIEDEHSG